MSVVSLDCSTIWLNFLVSNNFPTYWTFMGSKSLACLIFILFCCHLHIKRLKTSLCLCLYWHYLSFSYPPKTNASDQKIEHNQMKIKGFNRSDLYSVWINIYICYSFHMLLQYLPLGIVFSNCTSHVIIVWCWTLAKNIGRSPLQV